MFKSDDQLATSSAIIATATGVNLTKYVYQLVVEAGLTITSDEDTSDLDLQVKQFHTALQKYQEQTSGTKFSQSLDLDKLHSWSEVLEAVNDASICYDHPKGHWGKIRKALRKFGRNSHAFDAWARLLPSQSQYFSILCGGLQLIIGVCALCLQSRAL